MKKYSIAGFSIALMLMVIDMIGHEVPIYEVVVMGIDVLMIFVINWFMNDKDSGK